MIPLLAIGAAVFVADQLTKAWALARLVPGYPLPVVPGFFDLTLILNPGVAFGIFSGVPFEWRWLVTVFSLAALVLLCSIALRVVPHGGRLGRLALGLVFGGAAGNLLDRWRLGAVVDFVDVYWRAYHWPAFNVADSAITVGVVLLAVELAFAAPRSEQRELPNGQEP
ncbi:MAG TPA: signal peptidase II [Methylomirabilota bacterium]|nr:signal peptidase II [Methylomirabilota bacterium]